LKPDPLWLTKPDAARVCGLSTRQFGDVIPPRLDKPAQRGAGAKLRYHAPAVVAALVAYRVEQAAPAVVDPDPAMNGPMTDNLERYRGWKADGEELTVKERRLELVKTSEVLKALAPALTAMKSAGDNLVRKFGNEAGEIFNDGVAAFEAAAVKLSESERADG
jgi:hypothetical protein